MAEKSEAVETCPYCETERRKSMVEIKEEFYGVMTLETAYIYHEVLGIDLVINNGEITVAEDSIKNAPQQ